MNLDKRTIVKCCPKTVLCSNKFLFDGYLTLCCDAPPVGEIDYDSIDGYEGTQTDIAVGECGNCGQQSRLVINLVTNQE